MRATTCESIVWFVGPRCAAGGQSKASPRCYRRRRETFLRRGSLVVGVFVERYYCTSFLAPGHATCVSRALLRLSSTKSSTPCICPFHDNLWLISRSTCSAALAPWERASILRHHCRRWMMTLTSLSVVLWRVTGTLPKLDLDQAFDSKEVCPC